MDSRQRTILQMVIDQGQASVTDLVEATGVSEVTIHQGLSALERLSYLRCVHGFVASLDNDDVEARMMSNYTLERGLAEFAASLVQPSEAIFTENGSSNALLVRTLGKQKKDTTIVTVGSYIAHLLKDTPCEVILLGGVYQKKSGSMIGPLTRQYVQQIHFSKAFIDIDGWQPEAGFTGRDTVRADVVNAAPEKECEAIVLAGSSKSGAVYSYSTGPVERFDRVITDSKIRTSDLMHLKHSKPTVYVVDT